MNICENCNDWVDEPLNDVGSIIHVCDECYQGMKNAVEQSGMDFVDGDCDGTSLDIPCR